MVVVQKQNNMPNKTKPTVQEQIKGNKKLRRAYKKASKKQLANIKQDFSKLSNEELMNLRDKTNAKESPVKYAQILAAIAKIGKAAAKGAKVVAKGAKVAGKAVAKGAKAAGKGIVKGAKSAGKGIGKGAKKAVEFAKTDKGRKVIGAAKEGAGIISSAQQPASFSSPASNFKQMNFSGAGSPFNMKRTAKTFDFGSKKPQNKKNYKKAMDLNVDRYGPSATQSTYNFKADPAKDFSPHNISARRTEGTIKQQAKLRAARRKK